MKLIVRERGSAALVRWVGDRRLMTSAIARIETARTIRRANVRHLAPIDEVFATVTFVDRDEEVLSSASNLEPVELRTVDAIHLSTALRSVAELDGFITYDRRQSAAASAAGPRVVSPG